MGIGLIIIVWLLIGFVSGVIIRICGAEPLELAVYALATCAGIISACVMVIILIDTISKSNGWLKFWNRKI